MEEKKIYLISDLADAVGAPRTTINDWLNRYSSYIDFEYRGKRKVYFDSSIAVLREISALRSSGKSSFEIDKALAATYGIRPEVHDAPRPAPETPTPENAPAPEPAVPSEMPARRDDMEEITRLLGGEMNKIASQMEALQRRRHALIRTGVTVVSLLLLLLLAAAGVTARLINGKFAAMTRENGELGERLAELSRRNESLQSEIAGSRTTIEALARDGSARSDEERQARAALARQNAELLANLKEQRELFAARLAELEKSGSERQTAEMLKLRNDFAGQQRELLEKLEKMHADNLRLTDEVAKLKNAPPTVIQIEKPAPAPVPTPISTPTSTPESASAPASPAAAEETPQP